MRMATRLAVLLLFALVLRPAPADACKCLQPSAASAVKRADAVFWGEVTAVTSDRHRSAITVSVQGVWKGSVPATVTVYSTSTSCTILNVGLKAGKRWVFAARVANGDLHVRQCDGTRRATAKAVAAFDRVAGAAVAP
jgi:hypothetical protein